MIAFGVASCTMSTSCVNELRPALSDTVIERPGDAWTNGVKTTDEPEIAG